MSLRIWFVQGAPSCRYIVGNRSHSSDTMATVHGHVPCHIHSHSHSTHQSPPTTTITTPRHHTRHGLYTSHVPDRASPQHCPRRWRRRCCSCELQASITLPYTFHSMSACSNNLLLPTEQCRQVPRVCGIIPCPLLLIIPSSELQVSWCRSGCDKCQYAVGLSEPQRVACSGQEGECCMHQLGYVAMVVMMRGSGLDKRVCLEWWGLLV